MEIDASQRRIVLVMYSPQIGNHHPSLTYDDGHRYATATMISRSGNSPPNTVAYDQSTLHSWPLTDTSRYLAYPGGSIPNINEMTLLQSQSADQGHYWSESMGGGMIIQTLGRSIAIDSIQCEGDV